MFCKVWDKSNFAHVRTEHTHSQLQCIHKEVQLKFELQHGGTWSAAVWLPHHLWCRPAVFFSHLCLIALSFPQGKNVAAAWLPHHLWCRPAVFFSHLCLIALSFPQGKNVCFSKMLLKLFIFNVLLFKTDYIWICKTQNHIKSEGVSVLPPRPNLMTACILNQSRECDWISGWYSSFVFRLFQIQISTQRPATLTEASVTCLSHFR